METFDPYEVLGVSPAASDEKLKEAYHSLCSANHPDKLQGLGLPSDFSEIAFASSTPTAASRPRVRIPTARTPNRPSPPSLKRGARLTDEGQRNAKF